MTVICRDSSGNQINGYYIGPISQIATTGAAVIGDKAKKFTDQPAFSAAQVPYNSLLAPVPPWTYECWFRPDTHTTAVNDWQSPLSFRAAADPTNTVQHGCNFYRSGTNPIDGGAIPLAWQFWWGQTGTTHQYVSGAADSADASVEGSWHYLAATLDSVGGTVKFYVDGSLLATGTDNNYVPVGPTDWNHGLPLQLSIGNISDGFIYNARGGVDEVVINPSVRSAGQIAARYALSGDSVAYAADVLSANPNAYYRLDDDLHRRLRQFPRDDQLGHAPRQGRTNNPTSIQGSARQGWTNTYR